MCLNCGTSKINNFAFEKNGNFFFFFGVSQIFKHIMVRKTKITEYERKQQKYDLDDIV